MKSSQVTCLVLYLLGRIVIELNCSKNVPVRTCDPGWFGSNCQYKCRCGGRTCDQDGVCFGGICGWGWFGPACQFVDLVFNRGEHTTPEWIYDRDATTCNQDKSMNNLVVKLSSKFPFTWLRLQVNNPSLLHEFKVMFRERGNQAISECRNTRNATVNETTLDIHCDLDVLVQDVILNGEGVKSLCSLYVSGGRNVALRQNASQSSTYSNIYNGHSLDFSVASNAVDGKTDNKWVGKWDSKSCTCTSFEDRNPTWMVNLSSAHMINRYVVYFATFYETQIMGFVLSSFTNDLMLVFNYTDTEPIVRYNYTITNVRQTAPVSNVNIRTSKSLYRRLLSLCEVELYGDSACPPSRYGRECEHTCNCAVKDKSCFVSTGGCPSGCAAGFQGEGCDRVCDFGKYGADCSSNCSQFCVETNNSSSPCLYTDGACILGCASGYQSPKCEDISLVEMGDKAILVAVVVGPVVVVIILVVVALLGVFLWRRCRKNVHNQSSTKVSGYVNIDSVRYEQVSHTELDTTNSYKRSERNQTPTISQLTAPKQTTQNITREVNSKKNVYYNTTFEKSTTSIAVRDLTTYMGSHEKAFFQQQFNSVPVNINATTSDGMNEENKHKNRYKYICAYDHSRVLLKTSSEKKWGDYINASYIEGYRGQRKFIASQGPTKATLEDFVRMLSEQGVQVVVMLTNLTENGKGKCERYWPEDDEIHAGDIKVKLTTTQVFADYTIRRLQLLRDGDCVHELTQFHFTAWPDKDVPTTAWSLVDFEQRVASISTDKPIVVHCSAGIGRTGTFIALCNVLVEATETGYMDFFTAVQKLRHDRAYMVQTSDQYEFLHRAALVAAVCMGTTVVSSNFTGRIKELTNATDSGETLLDQEFKAACGICDDFSLNYNGRAACIVYEHNNCNNDDTDTNEMFDYHGGSYDRASNCVCSVHSDYDDTSSNEVF